MATTLFRLTATLRCRLARWLGPRLGSWRRSRRWCPNFLHRLARRLDALRRHLAYRRRRWQPDLRCRPRHFGLTDYLRHFALTRRWCRTFDALDFLRHHRARLLHLHAHLGRRHVATYRRRDRLRRARTHIGFRSAEALAARSRISWHPGNCRRGRNWRL
jgi:hypothetical protein